MLLDAECSSSFGLVWLGFQLLPGVQISSLLHKGRLELNINVPFYLLDPTK
jgi:hypothetical protein